MFVNMGTRPTGVRFGPKDKRIGLLICPAANNGHRTNNPPQNKETARRDGLNERPPHGGLPDFELFAITTRD
jgi:hypothetical protein